MALFPQSPHSLAARWRGSPFNTGRVPSGEGWIAGDVGTLGPGLSLVDDVLDVNANSNHVIACPMFMGVPITNELLMLMVFSDPYIIPASLAGMKFTALTAPTADAVFSVLLRQSGSWNPLATITIHPATNHTVSAFAAMTVAPSDAMQIVCPTTPDVTLADFSFAIPIFRT